MTVAVQDSAELRRILAIPRRKWAPDASAQLGAILTQQLKRPGGTQSLYPVQAQALIEIGTHRGMLGSIGVGEGKTLISLLAPRVLGSLRPLLLTKASLIEKTRRAIEELYPHWQIAAAIRIESYEALGRPSGETMLLDYQPDHIFADECHKVRNLTAACTRRLLRYLDATHVPFVAVSGTITKRSVLDYWHLMRHTTPRAYWWLPSDRPEAEEWGTAIDEKVQVRTDPGALRLLAQSREFKSWNEVVDPSTLTLDEVREAYRARMAETPGVVCTSNELIGTSLEIREVNMGDMKPPPVIYDAIKTLYQEWELPDGWELNEAVQVWRHAQELSLGFYYAHEPRPPKPWMDARRAWAKLCRHVIEVSARGSHPIDSAKMVALAAAAGRLGPQALEIYDAWKAIEPTFKVHQVVRWLSGHVIQWVCDWIRQNPRGLIWVRERAMGQAISKATGIPYFSTGAKDARGVNVGQYVGAHAILSQSAIREGHNLQDRWSANLVIEPPTGGDEWEQMIARTHRKNQPKDEVTVDVLIACPENGAAFDQAIADAGYITRTTGQPQKLTYADITRGVSSKIERHFPIKLSKATG